MLLMICMFMVSYWTVETNANIWKYGVITKKLSPGRYLILDYYVMLFKIQVFAMKYFWHSHMNNNTSLLSVRCSSLMACPGFIWRPCQETKHLSESTRGEICLWADRLPPHPSFYRRSSWWNFDCAYPQNGADLRKPDGPEESHDNPFKGEGQTTLPEESYSLRRGSGYSLRHYCRERKTQWP